MKKDTSSHPIVSRRRLACLLLAFGMGSAASVVATSAAADESEVPTLALQYDARTLGTEGGAKVLYHRIVKAAAVVCPQDEESHFVSSAVRECRAQSIRRAVLQINSPQLVALYTTNANAG
jgi:UrcA family protein